MINPTDFDLLRAAGRTPEAFGRLFDRHADCLFRSVVRQGVPAPEATELVAETFARAWISRRRVRDEHDGDLGPWLQGIADNLVRTFWRRASVESRARARLAMPQTSYLDEGVDDRLTAGDRALEIRKALDALPAEQASAVRLRVVEELEYSEIAHQLRISEQTARKRVSVGLRRLRTRLEKS